MLNLSMKGIIRKAQARLGDRLIDPLVVFWNDCFIAVFTVSLTSLASRKALKALESVTKPSEFRLRRRPLGLACSATTDSPALDEFAIRHYGWWACISSMAWSWHRCTASVDRSREPSREPSRDVTRTAIVPKQFPVWLMFGWLCQQQSQPAGSTDEFRQKIVT